MDEPLLLQAVKASKTAKVKMIRLNTSRIVRGGGNCFHCLCLVWHYCILGLF